jgi:hypothetical protein
MNHLVKAIINFRDPKPSDMKLLSLLLKNSTSIEMQQIYITAPDTNLIYASHDPKINLDTLNRLSEKSYSLKELIKLNKINDDYSHFV